MQEESDLKDKAVNQDGAFQEEKIGAEEEDDVFYQKLITQSKEKCELMVKQMTEIS